MRALTKKKLQELFTSRLHLKNPQFNLEKIGTKLSGDIISESFKGLDDDERIRMMWAALDAEFGAESVRLVGTLFAYTPAEWSVPLEADAR